jgi:ankyrin repeat protein
LLLSKHADISAKDKNGRTPLQLAASISDSAHLAIQDILRQAASA